MHRVQSTLFRFHRSIRLFIRIMFRWKKIDSARKWVNQFSSAFFSVLSLRCKRVVVESRLRSGESDTTIYAFGVCTVHVCVRCQRVDLLRQIHICVSVSMWLTYFGKYPTHSLGSIHSSRMAVHREGLSLPTFRRNAWCIRHSMCLGFLSSPCLL